MEWWEAWKAYTNYDKVQDESLNVTMTTQDENELNDDVEKLHLHKEGHDEKKNMYPGPINTKEQLESLTVDEQFLRHPQDIIHNQHIKPSMKEEEDFILLPHDVWDYLYDIYDGTDIPRFSIKIDKEEATEEGEQTKDEYIVEVFWKKIYIYILPKTRNHISLKKPSPLYITRKATVHDLRFRIAEII